MPSSEDQLINENSYSVKQVKEFMARYVKHKTIDVERIMRECQQSDETWYSTIKESITYWKLCFSYQDCKLINELQELDDKAIKASYHETILDDITKKLRYAKYQAVNASSINSLNNSTDQLNVSSNNAKQLSINIDDNERISFQQSLGACERLSDSFYHLLSFILCYNLAWIKQSPLSSLNKENQEFLEDDVIASFNSMNIPIIIDEQETRIFYFKDSHLDLIYKKITENDDFEDFPFPLEHYFASDLYIIHEPWSLTKLLNICMWHLYNGTYHRYLRFLFPNVPEYLNLSSLNNQNMVTLEDITCFLLILIIQRHIKCSQNKNYFKGSTFVGQTFFLSVIQHPIAAVSPKIEKFWYSLIANYGRSKYKYMINDVYSTEEINKIILEIRGECNNSLIKEIWGLLGIHLMVCLSYE
ncbi:hypothetical protein BCR36DRAFT_81226 [Piromyces finnis]|uniref:Uncharacterized protein n=1 Tax=Piromyces finnis TaxID=1754191 RepID=A0A1Y1V6K8_9FUNG|nr:hypothetical protein BCR36DRAFT_81226 [Piromyces finnis]|eukprot:ORX48448.1 hypothetical protein BCR36DRAFT_81226 [Piromyces finnis]